MANYASVTLVGHIGRDVEIRHMSDGMMVANFSLATSRKRGGNEVTTWWRAALFGKRAEVLAQYTKKGDALLITGEPFMRTYTDKDGSERQSLEVAVSDFAFLKGRNDDSGGGYAAPRPKVDPQAPVDDGFGDLPF